MLPRRRFILMTLHAYRIRLSYWYWRTDHEARLCQKITQTLFWRRHYRNCASPRTQCHHGRRFKKVRGMNGALRSSSLIILAQSIHNVPSLPLGRYDQFLVLTCSHLWTSVHEWCNRPCTSTSENFDGVHNKFTLQDTLQKRHTHRHHSWRSRTKSAWRQPCPYVLFKQWRRSSL